jgi:hypothetical protein
VNVVQALAPIVPFAFASGVNLYATVAVIGLCAHFHLVALPDQFRAFDNPVVIGIALAMYAAEFVADKIPWFDTIWDGIHTVVRPIGGAIVALSALGHSTPTLEMIAALVGGSVAMTSHLTKAGTRAVVNTSPEPFTNWTLSVLEDLFVVALTWFATQHPFIATFVAIVLLAAIVAAASVVVKGVRRRFARRAT